MVHSFGCHGISRINCPESAIGGVAGWFRSATQSLDVRAAQYPGCAHTGLRRRQLFQPNQPQNSGRCDAECGGTFTDGHLVAGLPLSLTVDQRANDLHEIVAGDIPMLAGADLLKLYMRVIPGLPMQYEAYCLAFTRCDDLFQSDTKEAFLVLRQTLWIIPEAGEIPLERQQFSFLRVGE